MNARVRLLFPLVQAIVILAFAFALHDSGPLGRSLFGDLDATEAESSLNSFAWALAVVGILRLAGGLASWLGWEPRSPVTEGQTARRRRFGGHVTAVSRTVSGLWSAVLWPVLLFGALLAAPRVAGSVAGVSGGGGRGCHTRRPASAPRPGSLGTVDSGASRGGTESRRALPAAWPRNPLPPRSAAGARPRLRPVVRQRRTRRRDGVRGLPAPGRHGRRRRAIMPRQHPAVERTRGGCGGRRG